MLPNGDVPMLIVEELVEGQALVNEFADHERRMLLLALARLERGDSVGFDYALWVGYGDGWRAKRVELLRSGYLSIASQREGTVRATERIRELKASMERVAA